ncbi:MAG: glycosyltransferase family 4 protein [Chloroflexi bacterium]|nr:glycosyltransferase family 4 protein [Chloroflexota bacterium]
MTRTLLAVLVTLGDPSKLTGGYLYHRRLAELAPRHGAQLEFVSVPERPFPLAIVHARRVMADIARAGGQVIVLDSIAAAFLGPWLTLRKPSRPMVGMLHQPPGGIDHGPVRRFVQARLDRMAYARARQLLVASDSLAEELVRGGQRPARITVVPPGRDVAVAAGPSPGDLRQGRRAAFLCVGNWVERKGILDLLDAFVGLGHDSATLHLVGDTHTEPSYGQRVRARLARPDLHERVVVHGPLAVAGVAAMYAAADAFVLPSLKEPYGTVYGEAMAFGLPVVGWRAGNLPYLAEHEREGLLVRPGKLAMLTVAMQRLADDADLRARLGTAARQRAQSRPTWDEVAALFFERLRAVAGVSQARSPL